METDIDFTDCQYRMEIGDGVRRSLIAYFRKWIGEQLKASNAASLATPDAIEKFAWRLSADFIAEIESQMQDSLPEAMMMVFDSVRMPNAQEVVASYCEDALIDFLDEVTAAKCEDALERQMSIWSLFLDEISDAPLVTLGTHGRDEGGK